MSINELLDLFRRLPSHRVADNLAQLLDCLDPNTQDELLSSVDQPLKVLQDGSGRDFLACDFNRDSDPDAESAEDAFRCVCHPLHAHARSVLSCLVFLDETQWAWD